MTKNSSYICLLHLFVYVIFVAEIDNIQVTIESQKSLLYEVASVSSNAKEFIISPMLDGANVKYAFDFYLLR